MPSPHAAELMTIELTDEERSFLRGALNEWNGGALCTEELAFAMGFGSTAELGVELNDHLLPTLDEEEPVLSRLDWLRVLLATEIVFASTIVGTALDWPVTVGVSDEDSIRILRSIQRKIGPQVRYLVGNGFGTRRRREELDASD